MAGTDAVAASMPSGLAHSMARGEASALPLSSMIAELAEVGRFHESTRDEAAKESGAFRMPKHAVMSVETGELRMSKHDDASVETESRRMPKHAAAVRTADGSRLSTNASGREVLGDESLREKPATQSEASETEALSVQMGLAAPGEAGELSMKMESAVFEEVRSFSMPADGRMSLSSRRALVAVLLSVAFTTAGLFAWFTLG